MSIEKIENLIEISERFFIESDYQEARKILIQASDAISHLHLSQELLAEPQMKARLVIAMWQCRALNWLLLLVETNSLMNQYQLAIASRALNRADEIYYPAIQKNIKILIEDYKAIETMAKDRALYLDFSKYCDKLSINFAETYEYLATGFESLNVMLVTARLDRTLNFFPPSFQRPAQSNENLDASCDEQGSSGLQKK